MFSFVGRLGIKEAIAGLLMAICLGLAIYSNTWHAPFVLDDIHSIVQNEARHTIKWSLPAFLGTRAMAYFTFDLNYNWGGLAVEGYHALNIAIHIITSALVGIFVYLVGRRTYPQVVWRYQLLALDNYWMLAITGGLIFLTHPIQTQSVNYIVQRMVLITTMFYVAALLAWWLYRTSEKRSVAIGWAAVSLISSVLAMHTKEIAITLPAAVVLMEYLFFSKTWRGLMGRWLPLLPWLITILIIPAYLLEVRGVFIRDAEVPPYAYSENVLDKINLTRISNVTAETPDISRWTYFVTQWSVITRYMRLIVWPAGLNIDHDIAWQDHSLDLRPLGSLAIILGVLIAGGWLKLRRRIIGAAGIALFFIALSVESSVIPIKDNIFEHRLYLPMVGVALITVEGLAWCIAMANQQGERAGEWLRRLGIAVVLMIIVFSGLSYARNGVWASALTLWSDAADKSPRKARPLNNLGLAWEEKGRIGDAENVYRQAQESNPDNVEVMVNLGALLGKTNRTSEALKILKRAIEIKPSLTSGYVNLGNVYLVRKEYQQAEEMFRRVVTQNNNASAWASLGDALLGQARNAEAIEALEKAVEIDQTEASWFNRLGALQAMEGRYDKAEAAFNEALKLDPKFSVARNNLLKLKRDQAAQGRNR